MHPVWRGIGCILWILDPIMAYAFASITVQALARQGMIPASLMGYVKFPDWVWKVPTLNVIAQFIGGLKDLWAMIVFFFVFALALAAVFITVYMMIYQRVGAPRYTAMDVPQSSRKGRTINR